MSNHPRRGEHHHTLRRRSDVKVGTWWWCNDPTCSLYGSHFDPAPSATDHARAAIILPRTAKGRAWQPDPSAIRSVYGTEDHNGVNGTR
jgi:hypothetical protein